MEVNTSQLVSRGQYHPGPQPDPTPQCLLRMHLQTLRKPQLFRSRCRGQWSLVRRINPWNWWKCPGFSVPHHTNRIKGKGAFIISKTAEKAFDGIPHPMNFLSSIKGFHKTKPTEWEMMSHPASGPTNVHSCHCHPTLSWRSARQCGREMEILEKGEAGGRALQLLAVLAAGGGAPVFSVLAFAELTMLLLIAPCLGSHRYSV